MPRLRFAPRTSLLPIVAVSALLCALPLLVVSLPPLVDAPGHFARLSVAMQQAADPQTMAGYFHVRPLLLPNIATDVPIAWLAPWMGLPRAFWLVTLAIPVLMAAAIGLLARGWNPRGAAGIGWALMFVWSSPFLWGFLNFWMGAAMAIAGFALWHRWRGRPVWREIVFWITIPVTFMGHAVAGCLLAMLIGTSEMQIMVRQRGWRFSALWPLAGRCRPLFAILPLIAWWRITEAAQRGEGGDGTSWSLSSKFEEYGAILRDQHMIFDIGCVLAATAIGLLGWRKGARFAVGTAWPVASVWIAYFALPFSSEGGSYLDMRFVPIGMMMLLALQDWSAVSPRVARAVLVAGLLLFAARIAITTTAFHHYEQANRSTLSALDHVERGARIMAFTERDCSEWRHAANSHIPSLAVHYRQAWVNSLWDVQGLHAMEVRYRPSPIYYHDPSQHIWAPHCENVGRDITDLRGGRSVREVLMTLPPDGYDYLWILGDRLTPEQARGRFQPLSSDANGALYRRIASARALTGRSSAASSSAQPAPTSQPATTSLGQ